jgi:hypothetical protein
MLAPSGGPIILALQFITLRDVAVADVILDIFSPRLGRLSPILLLAGHWHGSGAFSYIHIRNPNASDNSTKYFASLFPARTTLSRPAPFPFCVSPGFAATEPPRTLIGFSANDLTPLQRKLPSWFGRAGRFLAGHPLNPRHAAAFPHGAGLEFASHDDRLVHDRFHSWAGDLDADKLRDRRQAPITTVRLLAHNEKIEIEKLPAFVFRAAVVNWRP